MTDTITLKGTHRIPVHKVRAGKYGEEYALPVMYAEPIPRTRRMPEGMVWAHGPDESGYTLEGHLRDGYAFVKRAGLIVQRAPLTIVVADIFRNNASSISNAGKDMPAAQPIGSRARDTGSECFFSSTLILADGSSERVRTVITNPAGGGSSVITMQIGHVVIANIGLDGSITSADTVEVRK